MTDKKADLLRVAEYMTRQWAEYAKQLTFLQSEQETKKDHVYSATHIAKELRRTANNHKVFQESFLSIYGDIVDESIDVWDDDLNCG